MSAALPTAFVAGATGYVGSHVVAALPGRGVAPVAHVRPDSRGLDAWRARFAAAGAAVDTTPWDEDAMTATLRRVRPAVVLALLGTTRVRGRAASARGVEETYETVDYGLTALLLRATRAAADATGVRPRFVYLSSAGVGPRARGAYLAVRWRMEEALRASGVPFTIVRPAVITGADRPETRRAERAAAVAVDAALAVASPLLPRAVRDRWRSISGRDLAAALVRLALDPAAAGRVVTGEELR